MAKKVTKHTTKRTFDTMSITILLVMAIFGGLVGFVIGQSTGYNKAALVSEAAVMMKEKGMMMQDMGKLMQTWGTRYGDKNYTNQGKSLEEGGTTMMEKGDSMMTGY